MTQTLQTDDPATWFGGTQSILFVHAHPDDETIATGGTLAALAAAGRDPGVVTLTRGELGEVTAGPFASLAGTPELAQHRAAELSAALSMLGVSRHAFLGEPPARATGLQPRRYEDSGMAWGDDGFAVAGRDAGELTLTRAPAVEPITDLLHLAAEWGVGAIVSYDERGGYGHPDHVFAHRAARAVAHGLDIPFWQIEEAGLNGELLSEAHGAEGLEGLERHDVAQWWERKLAAFRAYSTQLTVIAETEIEHVGGQRHTFEMVEAFRRLNAPEA